jgi:chemotaxis protein MotB
MMAAIFPSCISKKKYLAAQNSNANLQRQNNMLQNQLTNARDSINNLRGNVSVLSDVYKSTNAELNLSKEQIIEQQKRLQHLQELINMQYNNIEAIRKKVADAMVNFDTKELSVHMQDGKVYVSMQESLLFPSGSAVVNKRGKDALAKLAGVLNTTPDINVEIEGHTDSIPINTKMYPDNWALSVARATSIARVLIQDYTVNPTRITASGRGEYSPVSSNSTDGGRAQNRRTEIIIEPKLDELMELIRGSRMTTTGK